DEWLRLGPVKAFADGTLGSRTASMLAPFADAGRGEALLSGAELTAIAGRCADAGLELAVHAIGDAANRAVLDALEATREPLAPLAGVQAAATRDWPSSEALAVEAALDGFWSGAAYARHAERRMGRLLPGYVADLVVLERDPVTCPPDEIAAIGVVATMAG